MKLREMICFISILVCFAMLSPSCGSDSIPVYTFPDTEKPEPPADGYPNGLKVVNFTDDLGGDKICNGYVVVADMKANPKLKFNTVHSSTAKAPTDIHANFGSLGKGTPCVTINGGYFWAGKSLSLLISDGVVKSIENQTVVRDEVTVYPLRSSFGMMADKTFETAWIYCVTDDRNKPYSFPSALDNDERTGKYMKSPPSSQTEGGKLWSPDQSIGGGPMLVKDGENIAVENYWKEVFDGGGIAGTSRQPRTAIGATADGKLVLIVCNGRNKVGSSGFTLSELADKLMSYGVVCAINLDGGGSSTIVGNKGVVLNLPSDSVSDSEIKQRKTPTAVVISEE